MIDMVLCVQSISQLDQRFTALGTDILLENSAAILLGGARPTPTGRRLAHWLTGQPTTLQQPATRQPTHKTAQGSGQGSRQAHLEPTPASTTGTSTTAAPEHNTTPTEPAAMLTHDQAERLLSTLPLGELLYLHRTTTQRLTAPDPTYAAHP